jgi:hypothetical protein
MHYYGCIDSCMWVVNFTPRPLYPQGKSPRYPLNRRLGGPQEPVWTIWRRENSWYYRDSNSDPFVVQLVACRYTDYAIPAQEHNILYHSACVTGPALLVEWLAFLADDWLRSSSNSFHEAAIYRKTFVDASVTLWNECWTSFPRNKGANLESSLLASNLYLVKRCGMSDYWPLYFIHVFMAERVSTVWLYVYKC